MKNLYFAIAVCVFTISFISCSSGSKKTADENVEKEFEEEISIEEESDNLLDVDNSPSVSTDSSAQMQ